MSVTSDSNHMIRTNFVGSFAMKRFAILVVAVFAVALMEGQSEASFMAGRSSGSP